VGFTEIFVAKVSPVLHNSLGVYLPLITTNCAVLGVALLNVKEANSFVGSILYGFGSAVGFSLVLVLFSLIRERLESANVPKTFQGLPIALITAGIMSLAFMGFSGIV
jgi:electron transport complex protein RnfA